MIESPGALRTRLEHGEGNPAEAVAVLAVAALEASTRSHRLDACRLLGDLAGRALGASWEAAERAYMDLAVNNLNSITRSYNLMAPDLAKKPYFTLQRELDACFADVAPLLADTIRERATRPHRPLLNPRGHGAGHKSVLARFGKEEWESTAKVYDSKAPHYGFKEMWRDIFAKRS
jgi:hypothetical protein